MMKYDPKSIINAYNKAHLYTVQEMTDMLKKAGCKVVEIAATPVFSDTFDSSIFSKNKSKWKKLKRIEMECCTKPELLGMAIHLLFVAKKIRT